MRKKIELLQSLILIIFALVLLNPLAAKDKRPFTIQDVMKFKSLRDQIISDDGKWVGYAAIPDRGDPTGYIQSTEADTPAVSIECATKPVFSKNGEYAAFTLNPKVIEIENAESDKDKPQKGMILVQLSTGQRNKFDKVESFDFGADSKWLAYKFFKEKSEKEDSRKSKKPAGTNLVLRHLPTGTEIYMFDVAEYQFDSTGSFFFYVSTGKAGKGAGVYFRSLKAEFCPESKICEMDNFVFSNLSWNLRDSSLAFLAGKADSSGEVRTNSLKIWTMTNGAVIDAIADSTAPKGWYIPQKNELGWTSDGKRLFFGFKPESERYDEKEKIKFKENNFYNIDSILKKRSVNVWNWNDPRIMTNQRTIWKDIKDKFYRAVYWADSKKYVQLADTSLPDVDFQDAGDYALGTNSKPYLKELTWDGEYYDLYIVNVKTGAKKQLAHRLGAESNMSPFGKYVMYFEKKHWNCFDIAGDSSLNLTENIQYPFWDEEHDTPSDPPPYGFGGWTENDDLLFIYDKYDIWKFITKDFTGLSVTLAEGREKNIVYRNIRLNKEKKYWNANDSIYISGFHKKLKYRNLYQAEQNVMGISPLAIGDLRIMPIAESKGSKRILFTKESYIIFPDLWVSDSNFKVTKQLTHFNSQLDDFDWGKSSLTEIVNSRGDTLQGWLIVPENFDSKKRYPTLLYFYEKFTDMFHSFFMPKVNHRPCYPLYTSDQYVIYMPDIKYYAGNPGYDATDVLVRSARKLIDMGIADSTAIALQGHSWGGYQTVFAITQTNMFAAASAGAPVGNMTSAYSGIRLESGLARQMQYEKEQSRIGGTLWDSLNNYINNSMVFKAQSIKTPLLIMFGDVDNAVPWQQGIEIYLAMRRLSKECYFLQYENEPHWPNKYQNRLDYALKMKAFFDHYLLKKPAPDWMTQGVPYKGE